MLGSKTFLSIAIACGSSSATSYGCYRLASMSSEPGSQGSVSGTSGVVEKFDKVKEKVSGQVNGDDSKQPSIAAASPDVNTVDTSDTQRETIGDNGADSKQSLDESSTTPTTGVSESAGTAQKQSTTHESSDISEQSQTNPIDSDQITQNSSKPEDSSLVSNGSNLSDQTPTPQDAVTTESNPVQVEVVPAAAGGDSPSSSPQVDSNSLSTTSQSVVSGGADVGVKDSTTGGQQDGFTSQQQAFTGVSELLVSSIDLKSDTSGVSTGKNQVQTLEQEK